MPVEAKPLFRPDVLRLDDAELQAITSSSKIRNTDRQVFTDPQFIAAVNKTGVEILTWKQVRELDAAK